MRSDLLCTCQGDRVEGIIHKTSQNSRRLTRLSVETALSASLCPFALDPSAKICENGQEWVNNGSTFESSWTLRKPLVCFSFSRNMTRIPMNMMIMMQLWHHKPNSAKQCKSKLMRSHVATAHAIHAIHAMPPSDSSERLQICAELPCHASWKMWEVQTESADSNPVFVLEPCSGQRTIFKGGSKIVIHDFIHCFSSAFWETFVNFPEVPPSPNGPLCLGKWPQKSHQTAAPSGTRHLGVPPGLVLCGRSRLLLCSSGARPRWQSNLIT